LLPAQGRAILKGEDAVLSAEGLDSIRRMTPDEKIRTWMALVRFSRPFWSLPTPEVGDRKWALWKREHDAGNENLLRALRERGML